MLLACLVSGHSYVYRVDLNNFKELLINKDWTSFRESTDPEYMWKLLYARIYDILTIMCPFKKFKQREKITPWITADIYLAMRVRDKYISLFRVTGYS